MPRKPKSETLSDKVKRYFRVQDSIKRGYKRSDKLLSELLTEMEPGQAVPLNEFEDAVLEDNFKTENKVFRAHGISRFEIKKVKA
jgi:hypothetical protein